MKKVFIILIYLLLVGANYYWLVVPTLFLSGKNFWELAESFVRLNIPQFFGAVFLISLPFFWLAISRFENEHND